MKYGLNGCYTNLDFNVPSVWLLVCLLAAALAVLIALLIFVFRRQRKKKNRKAD